eukprot:scaffold4328_cov135-Isochrysis_galbana.AAC.15
MRPLPERDRLRCCRWPTLHARALGGYPPPPRSPVAGNRDRSTRRRSVGCAGAEAPGRDSPSPLRCIPADSVASRGHDGPTPGCGAGVRAGGCTARSRARQCADEHAACASRPEKRRQHNLGAGKAGRQDDAKYGAGEGVRAEEPDRAPAQQQPTRRLLFLADAQQMVIWIWGVQVPRHQIMPEVRQQVHNTRQPPPQFQWEVTFLHGPQGECVRMKHQRSGASPLNPPRTWHAAVCAGCARWSGTPKIHATC